MVLISNSLAIILKNYLNMLKVPRVWLPTKISHTQRHNSPLSVHPNFHFMVWVHGSGSINPTVVLNSPGAMTHGHLWGCLPLLTTIPNYYIPLQNKGRQVISALGGLQGEELNQSSRKSRAASEDRKCLSLELYAYYGTRNLSTIG